VLIRLLERPLVVDDPLAPADAIVVLGAPLRNDRLTPILAERVDAAAALWRAGGAPIVIATGGVTSGKRAEADAIAEALRARGVGDVIVERDSKTTADNARLTAQLLPPRSVVWLVTQPFHGRRAARLFRDAGLEPRVWHIADSLEYRDRPSALRWVLREYAAWGKLLVRSKR
jgi:uncharacterized SAM-binding protein YcdF (DUF218 family)